MGLNLPAQPTTNSGAFDRSETKRSEAAELLQQAHDELEQRVIERTMKLEAANRELQAEVRERQRTAEALQAAEARYHGIFMNAVEGIFQSTPDGRYLSANPALAKMLGYDSPEELMATVTDIDRQLFVSPSDRAEFKRLLQEQGFVRGFETRFCRKDGGVIWVNANAHLVRDARGAPLYYEGSNEDITERKRSLVVLRESEERFRTLFESAPIGIALHGPDGKYLQTNQAYQQMVGYADPELRVLGVKGITHPDDIAQGQEFFCEMVAGKRDSYRREKRYCHKDGRLVWAQSAAMAIRKTRGELRYILSMVEDITARKHAEEVIRLRENNNRALLDAIPDLIIRLRGDGTILDFKAPEEQGFGFSPAIDVGQNLSLLDPNPLGPLATRYIERTISSGEIQTYDFQSVVHGEVFDLETRVVTCGPGEVLAMVRNITLVKRLEKEILEISEREQRRIGLDLHDGLGSHLTGVAFLSKALEKKLQEQGLSEGELAARISNLIVQALAQTRSLARGLLPSELQSNDLLYGLGELRDTLQSVFNVECFLECDPAFAGVPTPVSVQLYRIAQEAANNAIRHGRARRIWLQLAPHEQSWHLSVADDGIGLRNTSLQSKGMGFRSMRYRAKRIGGEIILGTSSVGGALVTCRFPKQNHEEGHEQP
ncbi:MAG: PAS domain S-box protein [Verrucomicrobia bacterium]|nr:PAS domain S-box protein [Verrucomicrobiota bacterium]